MSDVQAVQTHVQAAIRLLGRIISTSSTSRPFVVAATRTRNPKDSLRVTNYNFSQQNRAFKRELSGWSTRTSSRLVHFTSGEHDGPTPTVGGLTPPVARPPSSRGFASKSRKKSKGKDAEGSSPTPVATEGDGISEEDFDVFEASEAERDACYKSLEGEFASIRPNRAMPGMLDHVLVHAYDDQMPLKHLASSTVRDVSTLVVRLD